MNTPKTFHRLVKRVGLAFVALQASASFAHLPSYEGERVRNDNHFARSGFAQPMRGDCDINAFGPTDPNAGSANIYLGEGNSPPNFFCLYATQDDWTFDKPVDIIDVTRTPSPNPEDLGIALEEGYIPCSPGNPNPFQCPRSIFNPMTGANIEVPGQCIDSGQPDGVKEPDGQFHCALMPGSPRPRTSSVLFSTLTGARDVDWAVYNYSPAFGQQPIVAAPQVPACTETLRSFVTFAYMGPLDLLDARTQKPLFVAAEQAGDLPREVTENIPPGYGIRVTRPHNTWPTWQNPRPAYASGFAQNGWLLAMDSVPKCIDSFEECLADTTGELSKHYRGNDIFFLDEQEDVALYLAWWQDRSKHSRRGKRGKYALIDVSITTGVIDQFLVGDFANIGVTGPFSGNGRYIHGRCRDPRRTGKVDMVIETN